MDQQQHCTPDTPLGRTLEWACGNASFFRKAFFGFLILLVILNLIFFTANHHPHFVADAWPGFWPVFGCGVGVILVWLAKKAVQPLIKRPEDYYGDL